MTKRISELPAASSINAADEIELNQGGVSRKGTPAQMPTSDAVTTALAGKAATAHGHPIADVTGLQSALDGKAATSHEHAAEDLTSGSIPEGRYATGTIPGLALKNAPDGVPKAKLNADVRAVAADIDAGSAVDVFVNPDMLFYFLGKYFPVDGTAAGGNITQINSSDDPVNGHAGRVIRVDQNLTFLNTFAASKWVAINNVHATNTLTLTMQAGVSDTGKFFGSGQPAGATTYLLPPGGEIICRCRLVLAGDQPQIEVRGDSTVYDFGRARVSGYRNQKYNNLTGAQVLSATNFKAGSTLVHAGGAATYTLSSRLGATETDVEEELKVVNRGSGVITWVASGPTLVGNTGTLAAGETAVLSWDHDGTTERVEIRSTA